MNLLLDIARGIAALSVFLFHVSDSFEAALPALARIARFGGLGVALFFILSGYVIAASAEAAIRRNEAAGAFLKRRFLRIFPPFWLSILVVVAVPYLMAGVSALKSGGFELPAPRWLSFSALDWAELVTLAKVFMASDDDLQGQFSPVNSVYWTLGIEFQFYLCVYLALLFRRRYYPIIGAVTALSVLQLAWPLPLNQGLFIYFWPMFAIGILLQMAIARGWRADRLMPAALAGGGALAIVAGLLWLAHRGALRTGLETVFPSADIGFALCCALALWLAAPLGNALETARSRVGGGLRWLLKPAAFLGVISYSVYLLHGILVQLPGMIVRQLVPASSPANPLLTVAGTLLLCALFHRWAERPFMSRRQRALNDKLLEGNPDDPA